MTPNPSAHEKPIMVIDSVSHSYHSLSGETKVLDNICLSLKSGEFLAIVGPSGSGNGMVILWKKAVP